MLREDTPADEFSKANIPSGSEAKTLAGAASAVRESRALSQLAAPVINENALVTAGESGD